MIGVGADGIGRGSIGGLDEADPEGQREQDRETAADEVEEVEGVSGDGEECAAAAGEEAIEAAVEEGDEDESEGEECSRGWDEGKEGGGAEGEAGERDGEALGTADVEIVFAGAAAEDEEHPGHAAAEDIGVDDIGEAPAFEVRGLDVARQEDAMAGCREAVAEFDVLDGWALVETGIEAAMSEEDRTADAAAAGPEGMGGACVIDEMALLMNVMMEEVAIGADDARRGGLIIVGAEEGVELGIGLEALDGAMERVGMDEDVGVEEEDEFAAGDLGAGVASGGGAAGIVVANDDGAGVRRAISRAIGGAVIDDDDFEGLNGCALEGLEAACEVRSAVMHGDDDGDGQPVRLRPSGRRDGGELLHDRPLPITRRNTGARHGHP